MRLPRTLRVLAMTVSNRIYASYRWIGVFLSHLDGRATVVPIHSGETIGPGLFAKILRDTDLTRADFVKHIKK